ncbi:hypothetical protein Purlil1_13266 [Purpureocillium lilacinum]|uniref:Uncharacterized protein n=1 Tax=Purpureocillium lilacinum TaxID=33203 RepID=A0ABR0BEJ3_PURLI|nr:hypothetical protein Purlil1_13266 [Purpureocillium lilacinum]
MRSMLLEVSFTAKYPQLHDAAPPRPHENTLRAHNHDVTALALFVGPGHPRRNQRLAKLPVRRSMGVRLAPCLLQLTPRISVLFRGGETGTAW